MAISVELGNLEQTVELLVAKGRYHSKSEVLREGVRLVAERESRQEELDALLAPAFADEEAGRVISLDETFAGLRAKYDALARARRMKRKHMLTTEGWTDGTNYRTNERNERTTNDGTNERRNARTTRRRDRPARPR